MPPAHVNHALFDNTEPDRERQIVDELRQAVIRGIVGAENKIG